MVWWTFLFCSTYLLVFVRRVVWPTIVITVTDPNLWNTLLSYSTLELMALAMPAYCASGFIGMVFAIVFAITSPTQWNTRNTIVTLKCSRLASVFWQEFFFLNTKTLCLKFLNIKVEITRKLNLNSNGTLKLSRDRFSQVIFWYFWKLAKVPKQQNARWFRCSLHTQRYIGKHKLIHAFSPHCAMRYE